MKKVKKAIISAARIGFITTSIEIGLQHPDLSKDLLKYLENALKKEVLHNG